ncbi:protein MpOXR4 [Marchantia polymorpha subsp. ruderalis]|uniref:TLDc domain-containing protein n=2 Tax=Marchantia polymorpha TaxID=3197 RepID=A0AAF6AM78_MARPO|nr:hypothetical protein MARPO_0043s0042 [Marchantia polymorpha]BBM97548.1 hypothetical protein Mp_1g06490 [Marchantia polymorpha subsp. ruderalis]|eukprot:PTQ39790.1 hypothetical protein MARPO_0043s0042 [Marchantia polymorpha]
MGAGQSSSAENHAAGVLETKLRGSGDLTVLERAFECLSLSSDETGKQALIQRKKLEGCFGLAPLAVRDDGISQISQIMASVGSAIVGEYFDAEHETFDWNQLLEGYQKIIEATGVEHLKALFSVFFRASGTALEDPKSKVSKSENEGEGADITSISETQLQNFLLLCWVLMCHTRLPTKGNVTESGGVLEISLPNINSLMSAAVSACEKKSKGETSAEQIGREMVFSISNVSSWILSTIPALSECLVRYVRAQLTRIPVLSKVDSHDEQNRTTTSQSAESEEAGRTSDDKQEPENAKKDVLLLHSGTAWAVGLSLKDYTAAEILFRASCGIVEAADVELPTLLYRSSLHGRGLNRFWTCVDGYRAPVIVLISAQTQEESSPGAVFVMGTLVSSGFENKESSYGASGCCLYSVEPLFCPFRTSGKEKYYVYSHKHTPGAVYRAQPANEGIGLGGSYGKERVWLDKDFATLTVRHHAVDKTYHPGGLVPGQGFSPVSAQMLEIEIWGLGGVKAEQDQAKFLNRENLFSEQRRKIDLAAFGNWENSPEKMMMEMMADPNAGRRQER